jgi:hypothetical protein
MQTTPDASARPSRRWLIVLIVAIQIAIPGYGLVSRWVHDGTFARSEALFSFQMYSLSSPAGYAGVSADGTRTPLSTAGLPLVIRGINYGDTVPRLLCQANPGLSSVDRVTGHYPGTYPC